MHHMMVDIVQGLSFEETEMLNKDKEGFIELVNKSLIHHFHLIKN